MPHDHLEIEAKYSVSEGSALPTFEDLEGIAAVDRPAAQDLVADYFDTDDLRLAGLGITLRRRTGGDDAGWHLKVPVAEGRHEIHEPSTIEQTPPPAVLDALGGIVRRRRLTPMVRITTRRTAYRLRDAGGVVLAEVADDRVEARSAVPGMVETGWREWEVELVDGDAELLQQVCDRFERAGAEPASHSSKLARALGESLAPLPGEPGIRDRSNDRAHGVVRARLRDQVMQLLRWEVLVRRDVVDSVHQMRVTVRRLRSALATNRPMFDTDRTEPLRAELKWLGSVLGAARDAEVLRDRIGEMAAQEAAEDDPRLLDLRTITAAHDELDSRYHDSHHQVVQELNSARYAALVDRLDLLVTDPPWTLTAEHQRSGALRRRVRHEWKRLKAAVARAHQARDVELRQQRLHDARKAAKRARYAAEPLIPVYGTDAERFVKATTKVQTTLGDLHDAIVTMDELEQLAANETVGHDAQTLGLLRSREEADSARIEAKFEKAWHRARRKRVLRWLT